MSEGCVNSVSALSEAKDGVAVATLASQKTVKEFAHNYSSGKIHFASHRCRDVLYSHSHTSKSWIKGTARKHSRVTFEPYVPKHSQQMLVKCTKLGTVQQMENQLEKHAEIYPGSCNLGGECFVSHQDNCFSAALKYPDKSKGDEMCSEYFLSKEDEQFLKQLLL